MHSTRSLQMGRIQVKFKKCVGGGEITVTDTTKLKQGAILEGIDHNKPNWNPWTTLLWQHWLHQIQLNPKFWIGEIQLGPSVMTKTEQADSIPVKWKVLSISDWFRSLKWARESQSISPNWPKKENAKECSWLCLNDSHTMQAEEHLVTTLQFQCLWWGIMWGH